MSHALIRLGLIAMMATTVSACTPEAQSAEEPAAPTPTPPPPPAGDPRAPAPGDKASKSQADWDRFGEERKDSTPGMKLTGGKGEVRVRLAISCNCAEEPTFKVTTKDWVITVQEVMPEGPLARCAEDKVLFATAAGLAPGEYRVEYFPDGAGAARFVGQVKVD